MNADSLNTITNSWSVGAILIQILTGFVGSLFAGLLVMIISERRFNKVMETSEQNITNAMNPINNTVVAISQSIQSLAGLVPVVSIIGSEIKTLSQLVDKIREGLEKTE